MQLADGRHEVLKWNGASAQFVSDELAEEAPLEIRIRGQSLCVTMRTPGHDEELAAGFLVSEGIIRGADDLIQVRHCQFDETGNTLNAMLAPRVRFEAEKLTRYLLASSSCGICGKATIDAIHAQFPPIDSSISFALQPILRAPGRMRAAQATFDRTGGLHAAAAFDNAGELVVLREDIGRHNAVDKVIGYCVLQGKFPLANCLLLVSGRSSFEIMQKALAARVPIVAAVSAPSSLAVEFAIESNQALIGFLRGQRMNIYSCPRRVSFA